MKIIPLFFFFSIEEHRVRDRWEFCITSIRNFHTGGDHFCVFAGGFEKIEEVEDCFKEPRGLKKICL